MISLKKNKIDISHEFPLLNTGTTALSVLVLGIVLVLAFRVKVWDMYTIRGVHTQNYTRVRVRIDAGRSVY